MYQIPVPGSTEPLTIAGYGSSKNNSIKCAAFNACKKLEGYTLHTIVPMSFVLMLIIYMQNNIELGVLYLKNPTQSMGGSDASEGNYRVFMLLLSYSYDVLQTALWRQRPSLWERPSDCCKPIARSFQGAPSIQYIPSGSVFIHSLTHSLPSLLCYRLIMILIVNRPKARFTLGCTMPISYCHTIRYPQTDRKSRRSWLPLTGSHASSNYPIIHHHH